MKILLIVVFCLLSYGRNCYSIPQNFGGNLFGATFLPQKIANDFTEKLIATSIWEDNDLPGQWKRIPSIDKDTILMLSVRPLIWMGRRIEEEDLMRSEERRGERV